MLKNPKEYKVVFIFSLSLIVFFVGIYFLQTVITSIGEDFSPVTVVNNNEPIIPDVAPEIEKEDDTVNAVVTETLILPSTTEIQIVRNFYDDGLTNDQKEKALTYFDGVYRPNFSTDFASNDKKAFDVVAIISGKITDVKEDGVFGTIVTLTNDKGVSIIYQSLSKVSVKKGDTIQQNGIIGQSGENMYAKELGNHVSIVLEKDGNRLNPEKFFNQPISNIK